MAKYDSSGRRLWTQQLGTAGNDEVRGVAVDSAGIFITGYTDASLGGTNAGDCDTWLGKYILV